MASQRSTVELFPPGQRTTYYKKHTHGLQALWDVALFQNIPLLTGAFCRSEYFWNMSLLGFVKNATGGFGQSMELIRAACVEDAAALARVHVDSWQSAYQGLLPQAFLEQMSYKSRLAQWQYYLGSCLRGAFDLVVDHPEQGVVGFATAGRGFGSLPGFEGELFALYLLPAFQGKGYGKKLVARAFAALLKQRILSAAVWVLKDNSACGFYEALGAEPVAEQTLWLEAGNVMERAYGWPNLKLALRRIEGELIRPRAAWPWHTRRPAGQEAEIQTPTASPRQRPAGATVG